MNTGTATRSEARADSAAEELSGGEAVTLDAVA
jgi:hypothetical protein